MGFWNNLIGDGVKDAGEGIKSAGEGVKSVIDSSGGWFKDIRTAITGIDPDSKARIEEILTNAQSALQDNKHEIDKIIATAGAQHKNPFVAVFLAGWRPAIGWVAAVSLAFYFIPQYIMGSFIWAKAAWMAMPYMDKAGVLIIPELPMYPVSADGLMELVLGMLGLIAARSIEKYAGTQDKH